MATYASQIGTTISKRMSDEPSFKEAYAEHRAKWLKGEAPPTFTWNDKKYSVATREEAARQKEMMESPMRGRGMGRMEPPAPPSRSDATKMMADRAASGAQSARAASESRAAAAGEAESEKRRESRGQARDGESTSGMGSRITNRPAPGARSIYEDLDLGKVAGAAGTIASAFPAGRLAKTGVDALKAARASRSARAAKEMEDRVEPGFKRGGSVKGAGIAQRGVRKCKVY